MRLPWRKAEQPAPAPAPEPDPRCTAVTRKGTRCALPAFEDGRCRLHRDRGAAPGQPACFA